MNVLTQSHVYSTADVRKCIYAIITGAVYGLAVSDVRVAVMLE